MAWRKTLTIHGISLQLCSMSVSNSKFVLRLLTAQELYNRFRFQQIRTELVDQTLLEGE